MPFELLIKTKTKLTDVEVLSQKNRQPDENPGVKLSVEMSLSNDMLAFFDGSLRSWLYTKNGAAAEPKGKQAQLDGITPVSDTPDLTNIGKRIGAFHWDSELTGYELVIDQGLGGRQSDIELDDCKLDNWRLIPKEGGSFVCRFNIECTDASEKIWGKLAKLKSREIEVRLLPPTVAQTDIEDDDAPPARGRRNAKAAAAPADGGVTPEKAWPFPKKDGGAPARNAGDAFAAAHKH